VVRAELLEIMFARMEHVAAESLHGALIKPEHPWERRLKSRLAELVPDGATRRRVLATLAGRFAASHAAVPGKGLWVRLEASAFKTSGTTTAGNDCASCPENLGLRADGTNAMELRGDIAGDGHGVAFDFKRTLEMATWKQVGHSWKATEHVPAGTDDDRTNTDEDLKGDDGHIYVIDPRGPLIQTPASSDPFAPNDPAATRVFYVASFVEWVEADVGGSHKRVSDEFEWHSATTLRKVSGKWERDPSAINEIAPGAFPIMSPTGDLPP